MQIESLSKRLDRYLYCKTEVVDMVPTVENYYRVVKRVLMDVWTEMSPAKITTEVIDPVLKVIADTFNEWEEARVGTLPVVEDEVVACFLCTDGQVPVRMLICPTSDESQVIIVVDLLAERLTTHTP